jgi:DNA-binding GntR family transcriptional regulator
LRDEGLVEVVAGYGVFVKSPGPWERPIGLDSPLP